MNDDFTFKLWFMIHMIYDEFWWILMWDAKMVPAISGEAKVLSDMTFVDLPYEKPQEPMVVLGRSALRHGHVASPPCPRRCWFATESSHSPRSCPERMGRFSHSGCNLNDVKLEKLEKRVGMITWIWSHFLSKIGESMKRKQQIG